MRYVLSSLVLGSLCACVAAPDFNSPVPEAEGNQVVASSAKGEKRTSFCWNENQQENGQREGVTCSKWSTEWTYHPYICDPAKLDTQVRKPDSLSIDDFYNCKKVETSTPFKSGYPTQTQCVAVTQASIPVDADGKTTGGLFAKCKPNRVSSSLVSSVASPRLSDADAGSAAGASGSGTSIEGSTLSRSNSVTDYGGTDAYPLPALGCDERITPLCSVCDKSPTACGDNGAHQDPWGEGMTIPKNFLRR